MMVDVKIDHLCNLSLMYSLTVPSPGSMCFRFLMATVTGIIDGFRPRSIDTCGSYLRNCSHTGKLARII